jgi:DNA-directed RNA polymerase specialized sigma24 family protein
MPDRLSPDEEAAFEAFYLSSLDLVYGVVRRHGANPEEAKDMTHEAFLRAYTHWEAIGRRSNPIAWVILVAKNLAREVESRIVV